MSTLEIILTALFFILMIPTAALVKVVYEAQYISIDATGVACAGVLWPVTLCIAIVGGILWYVILWLYKWYGWCYRTFKKLFKI